MLTLHFPRCWLSQRGRNTTSLIILHLIVGLMHKYTEWMGQQHKAGEFDPCWDPFVVYLEYPLSDCVPPVSYSSSPVVHCLPSSLLPSSASFLCQTHKLTLFFHTSCVSPISFFSILEVVVLEIPNHLDNFPFCIDFIWNWPLDLTSSGKYFHFLNFEPRNSL